VSVSVAGAPTVEMDGILFNHNHNDTDNRNDNDNHNGLNTAITITV